MTEIFRFITPFTYWVLIALWSFILCFYITKMWGSKTKKLFLTLIIILAIDAFRTLFESIYFGIWNTSLSGFIPKEIGIFLMRPELVIIPKIINVIAAVIVIVLLLKRWLPREEEEQIRLGDVLQESENKYRSLFEQAGDYILVLKPQPNGPPIIVDANQAAIDKHGFEREEFIGKPISDIDVDVNQELISKRIKRLLSGEHLIIQMNHVRKDGSIFPVESSIKLFENSLESPLFVAVERDITERKKAEEAIQKSEEWFRHLSDATFEGIVFHDEGYILHANDQYYEMFGYKPEELAGIDAISLTATSDSVKFIKDQISLGNFGPYEVVGMKKGGTEFPMEIRSKMSEFDGIITRMAAIRDLTEQKQAEEEKVKLEAQLRQAQKMEAIGTLAGGIAHDFNNILGAIIGYTEMARDDSPNESSVAKDLNKVLEASTRATDLVKQILAFSRQDDTEYTLLQPAGIVKRIIALLRPTLPVTIEITQNIDTETGFIFADPTQVHQVLMNLCTNAFHAMEKTGGILAISLIELDLCREDTSREPHADTGTFIQLSVSDSGPGMTQEVKDKIFDPYYTTKGIGKGTGMGLAIVHGIIKSYDGFITLSSEPGKGTSFHIFLPVVNEERLPEKEALKQIPVGEERILFIDDEEVLAQMGKDMLERLGYRVTVRKSSLEALETFQNQPDQFDLVITDQTMPGMAGVDLARRMLQIRPDIPIILCTGYSSVVSEEKAKFLGIREFALKPLSKKNIAVLIRKALGDNSELS